MGRDADMEHDLDQKLAAYAASDIYPFHMPGHKRQRLGDWRPEEIDITEIDGFDNLHHAEGIIKEGQERLAGLAGADESFYLVNGSTCGLLAAICGCVKKGDRILMGRNCHKAVYHAAYLMELRVEYLYPKATDFGIQGSVLPGQVKERLRQFPDTAAVVITSPTYDGIVSDIAAIARLVHEKGIPLIVDEAHGAHFGFSDGFPEKAVRLGADLCIESLHKTLPSYTQTAALHLAKTEAARAGEVSDREWIQYRFDRERVKRYLGIFQSSSPSYIFMAGMDRCVRMLRQDRERYADPESRRESLLGKYEMRLRHFYESCRGLRYVQVCPWFPASRAGRGTDPGIWAKDNSKILISARRAGVDGQQLYDCLLERYHLQMEMASGHYVTALTSLMDTEEGFMRLQKALQEIDAEVSDGADHPEETAWRRQTGRDQDQKAGDGSADVLPTPLELYCPREKYMELWEAMDAETEERRLAEAAGCISAEFIYLYPPGIPVLAPGEVVTEAVIRCITDCRERGLQVQGMQDLSGERIRVVKKTPARCGKTCEP